MAGGGVNMKLQMEIHAYAARREKMRKVLKLDTAGNVTQHDCDPDALRTQIGPTCECLESVRPGELHRSRIDCLQTVMMLVDEEGKSKGLPVNPLASFLYGALRHGDPIVGDVLFVDTEMTQNSHDFCGLSKDALECLGMLFGRLLLGEEK